MGIFAFTSAPVYRSSAIVKGVENRPASFGSLIASKLSGLGNIGGFGSSLGDIRGDYYLLVLRERSMAAEAIERFDLRERLKMTEGPIENVFDAWKNRVYFKHESATNTLHLQVDDRDPEFAKEVVEFYIDRLGRRIRELESSKARAEREFAASELEEARSNLYLLEDSLASFQSRTGIFDLEEQVKATVQAAAAVQAERLIAIAEIELKKKLFAGENPELNLAKLKLASLDSSMSYLTTGGGKNAELDFILRLDSATEEGKTFLRLFRDIELHSILVAILTQQFEQAKMEEARNTPTLAIVEPPSLGTKPVAPKRAMIIGLGLILGFVLGLLAAGIVNMLNSLASPEHPEHAKFQRLRRSWSA